MTDGLGTYSDKRSLDDELRPLLSLLDDTDTTVTTAVHNKLTSYGRLAVPYLRSCIEQEIFNGDNANQTVISNATACIRGLQTGALSSLLDLVMDAHSTNGDVSLEASSMYLAAFGFPEIDTESYKQKLDELALRVHSIFISMKNPNDLTLLLSLNTVFFEQENIRGASKNYYAPENSYINTLIDTKRGIPISISIVYMLIAERVGIELHGIGMPLHFLVYHPLLDVFIDTFNVGAFISRQDCEQFIKQSGFSYSENMLVKSTNISILIRKIRNLIYAHSKYDQTWEAETLQETLDEILHLTNS
ncbi:MAG: transglutaminase family protein [Candidatus Kapabacteria bacterium]|nr:transglutaminase family protein [Candidatus Kapabacteria bacterium]